MAEVVSLIAGLSPAISRSLSNFNGKPLWYSASLYFLSFAEDLDNSGVSDMAQRGCLHPPFGIVANVQDSRYSVIIH